MIFKYMLVEKIPDKLNANVIYHNEEFEIASLLCPCGCGHRIDLIVPDSHFITHRYDAVTVQPSIAVCNSECGSHFFITDGNVEWLPSFSESESNYVMQRQIARHVAQDNVPHGWVMRLRNAGRKFIAFIKRMLHL